MMGQKSPDQKLDALIIEYRKSKSEARRNSIREMLWIRNQEYAYKHLLNRIKSASVSEASFAKAQTMLDPRVFQQAGFSKIAEAWDPKGGRHFELFFRKAITWRCGDVIRRLVGKQEDVVELPIKDDVFFGMAAARREEERSPAASGEVLLAALRELEHESGPGNPTLGKDARAVFELINKAYIEPDHMGECTRAKVKAVSGGDALQQLRDEYLESQRSVKELERELEDSTQAVQTAIQKLEHQKQELAQTQGKEYLEVSSQLFRKRAKRQKLREEYAALHQGACRQLLRSQMLVGEWLGMDQATVSRRYKFAKDFLRRTLGT